MAWAIQYLNTKKFFGTKTAIGPAFNATRDTATRFTSRKSALEANASWPVAAMAGGNIVRVPVLKTAPVKKPKKRRISDKKFRETAEHDYSKPSNECIEIDSNAAVLRTFEGHAWVQAWVYVRMEDVT